MTTSKTVSKTGKQNIHTLLPIELIAAIDDLKLNTTYRSKAIHLCTRIFQKFVQNDTSFVSEYVQIPSEYFRTFDTNYTRITNPLKAAGIIQVYENADGNPSYLNGEFCIAYRLNPDLISSNFKSTSYTNKKTSNCIINETLRDQIKDSLKKLTVDYQAAYAFIETYTSSISTKDFIIQDVSEIAAESIKVRYGTQPLIFWKNKEKALKEAQSKGLKLFQGNDVFVIDSESEFIARKKQNIKYRYLKTLKDMEKGIYSIIQSGTNNRVFTNITSTANKLLQFYSMEGEKLVSNDLANSQLAILAYILKSITNNNINEGIRGIMNQYEVKSIQDVRHFNSEEIKNFIELSESGEIYTYLKQKLNLKDRDTAKLVMFTVLFSSHKSSSTYKTQFTALFPAVMSMLEQFKKDNYKKDTDGDQIKGSLPVMLQKIESYIFIDLIYNRLTDHAITCFSKHDSFLSKATDAPAVKLIMESVFTELNIVATIKTEEITPNEPELVVITNKANTGSTTFSNPVITTITKNGNNVNREPKTSLKQSIFSNLY